MIIKRFIKLILIIFIITNYLSAQDQQGIGDNVSQYNYTSLEKKIDQIIESNLSINDCNAKADYYLNSKFKQSKAIPYLRYGLYSYDKKKNLFIMA